MKVCISHVFNQHVSKIKNIWLVTLKRLRQASH